MSKAKILLLDIETAPLNAYVWGLYDQNLGHHQVMKHGYMLSWAAKWYGNKKVMFDNLINHPRTFKKNPCDDSKICKSIWDLMNEADIIISHYGDQFDLKKLNSYFLKNKLGPVSSFKSVDTVKALRRHFGFASNKLDAICEELSLGTKIKHEGFDLWLKCMAGEKKANNTMKRYNIHDVNLLEIIYEEIKPYINHPNLTLYEDNPTLQCKKCLSTDRKKIGYRYTAVCKYQRYKCKNCGSEYRDNKNLIAKQVKSK